MNFDKTDQTSTFEPEHEHEHEHEHQNHSETKQLQSLVTRSNMATLLVLIPFLVLTGLQFYVSKSVRESRDLLVHKEIPIAVNALAMLHELDDMNSNMLEHILGEKDGVTAYYDNMDEYEKFLGRMPEDKTIQPEINRITRLVRGTTEIAEEKIFSFDNRSPESAKQRAAEISNLYGWPLISLLKKIGESTKTGWDSEDDPLRFSYREADGKTEPIYHILNAEYYIRLVMNALRGHAHNDLEAKYQFFDELLQLELGLENFLKTFEDSLQEATVIEMSRLLAGMRHHGTEMIQAHDVRKFILATTAIDEIEHNNYKTTESILTDMTDYAQDNIASSVQDLNSIVNQADTINIITALAGCFFLVLYLLHIKISFLRPIEFIANTINAMRAGEKKIDFNNNASSLEVFQIVSSLEAFQKQLFELEELQNSQRLEEKESHRLDQEKAYAELEKREQTQRATASELRKVNQDLEQFVHIASHDLRDPLKKMSTFYQMLELELGESVNKEGKNLLGLINQNIFSMAALIDDLRALTRIHDSNLEVTQCNLESMLHEVIANHSDRFEGRNTSINIGKLPTIPGYARLLKQVFDNLVRNAAIHGDEKLLIISVNCEPSVKGYTLEFVNSSSQTIQDPGHLLQPFVRGSGKGDSGTGMGLAICKKIVNVHNGSISIDTSVKHRFTVRIEFDKDFVKPKQREASSCEHY